MLDETYYDTVHNFLDFHQSFRKTENKNLRKFFQNYDLPINRRHHMCVSLAMEIIARVAEIYPDVAEHFYLVSCEEAVEDSLAYVEHCEEEGIENSVLNLEKEHSLVAMKVVVAGRNGILILDPGYHVARAVTVMVDKMYPHTGWFTQTDDVVCKREYSYAFSGNGTDFVEWKEKCTRGDKEKFEESVVFVDRPYKTAIDVTVRRNLVYNFRSLLTRNAKGRVCAGIYFPVLANDTHITLFYDVPNTEQSIKIKYKMSVFNETDFNRFPHALKLHLESLAPQLRFELDDLVMLLKQCSDAMSDFDFVKQLLLINSHISELSLDN